MDQSEKLFLSGNEAVALAALHNGIVLGTGYPGTPSTEILENFSEYGGKAQWAPNEKVAMEVALGASFSHARTLVTMKHVGVNVAADPLFTAAYTGVSGAMVIISADDPGMASSQNEQDNRHYARAAGVPMLEPSDSQQAYDFTRVAIDISEKWHIPVILRLTTRICHSKTVVKPNSAQNNPPAIHFEHDIPGRVMIPAYARQAHRRLRQKLAEIAQWNEDLDVNQILPGDTSLGIITSGVCFPHTREAAPEAGILKLSMTYPLPMEKIKSFVNSVDRCLVIEEGDPYLLDSIRAAGTQVEGKAEMYRFGELDVPRIKRIMEGDTTPEQAPLRGKPPQLCEGCPHRTVFEILRDNQCIVAGDIGCYTLGVLPPFEAMDTCVCMGASIGVGLGMRHVLPDEQARKVVSVIGDSTFVHSGITGLVEMAYNQPKTGHVVLILDNGTTAMTGLQEHPGTGRSLDHQPTNQLNFEALARAIGIERVFVLNPRKEVDKIKDTILESLRIDALTVIIVRSPCLLAAKKIKQYSTSEKMSE
jgi:indolepyruvate ferredoxin oxidoreductase alpha subunit